MFKLLLTISTIITLVISGIALYAIQQLFGWGPCIVVFFWAVFRDFILVALVDLTTNEAAEEKPL